VLRSIVICNKNKILNKVTKWGQNQWEERCWHTGETVMMRCFNKYYYAMKTQYNNISTLKVKRLNQTYQSEYDVRCYQSMIANCGKISHKYNEVNFFTSSNREQQSRGTWSEKRKGKQNQSYCQWYITLTICVVSLSESFPIDYLSNGQWSIIDNKEWEGSYTNTTRKSVA
jgi:hypothetical protein